jgi:hypothetical protein
MLKGKKDEKDHKKRLDRIENDMKAISLCVGDVKN